MHSDTAPRDWWETAPRDGWGQRVDAELATMIARTPKASYMSNEEACYWRHRAKRVGLDLDRTGGDE